MLSSLEEWIAIAYAKNDELKVMQLMAVEFAEEHDGRVVFRDSRCDATPEDIEDTYDRGQMFLGQAEAAVATLERLYDLHSSIALHARQYEDLYAQINAHLSAQSRAVDVLRWIAECRGLNNAWRQLCLAYIEAGGRLELPTPDGFLGIGDDINASAVRRALYLDALEDRVERRADQRRTPFTSETTGPHSSKRNPALHVDQLHYGLDGILDNELTGQSSHITDTDAIELGRATLAYYERRKRNRRKRR
jgi:hypothetical protein